MTATRKLGSHGPSISAFIIAFGLISSATAATGDRPVRKPNVVVILSDDMGYADIGVHGNGDFPTPNIDARAGSGVRCSNGYVSGHYSSPTRAGLLIGRYQQRFGHEWNPSNFPEVGLPLSERTLADRLKAAGYSTGLVGKWHLSEWPWFSCIFAPAVAAVDRPVCQLRQPTGRGKERSPGGTTVRRAQAGRRSPGAWYPNRTSFRSPPAPRAIDLRPLRGREQTESREEPCPPA
ncbi:MAG: sulfatase-like hydrolase/transferase [Isosphaeraceae bacterium]